MKIKPLALCLTLISAAVLTGCNAPNSNQNGDNSQTTSAEAAVITIKSGETFPITLAANHSTGYTWSVAEIDSNLLMLTGDPSYKSTANDSMVGQPGEATFTFKGIAPGTTTLKMIYHRPFDKDVAAVETYQRTVTIQ